MDGPKTNNLTERAVYALREKLIGGAIPGGARLYEVALSEELQISRTPVRQAMARLAEEGLLERASGGGYQVRSFTQRDVVDAIELRGVLEGMAARMAAERGASAAKLAEAATLLEALDGCFHGGEGALAFESYSDLNGRFHDMLAELCESPVVLRELERVKSLPFASPSAFVMGRQDPAASRRSLVVAQQQHRALIEAIAAREGARAEAIAREHARIARGNLEAALDADRRGANPMPGLSLIVP